MKLPIGLFITGTDTEVGKTYVAANIARALRKSGCNVGVYKPVASGCPFHNGRLIAEDAVQLWEAAGKPKTMKDVCPFRFERPLAPHLAAEAEGHELSFDALVQGIDTWADAEFIIVEGAGGLMSPLGDNYVADLAEAFGFPLVVVAENKIGVINQTLQTLIAASTFNGGLGIAGIVLNTCSDRPDPSRDSNAAELRQRCVPPLLAEVGFGEPQSLEAVDWRKLADREAGAAS